MRSSALVSCFLFACIACGACGRRDGASVPPVPSAANSAGVDGATRAPAGEDVIELQFRDASVPPMFHRSYVITVTRTAIRKTVDSYGNVISDDKAPFTSADFDALVDRLTRKGLQPERAGEDRTAGCTGGKGWSLRVHVGKRLDVVGSLDRCGGKESGTLSGDVDAWVKEINSVAPSAAAPAPSH